MRRAFVAVAFVVTFALLALAGRRIYYELSGHTVVVVTNVGPSPMEAALVSDRNEKGPTQRIAVDAQATFEYDPSGDAGLTLACSSGGQSNAIPIGYATTGLSQTIALDVDSCREVRRSRP